MWLPKKIDSENPVEIILTKSKSIRALRVTFPAREWKFNVRSNAVPRFTILTPEESNTVPLSP